jgi:hypothetical protein
MGVGVFPGTPGAVTRARGPPVMRGVVPLCLGINLENDLTFRPLEPHWTLGTPLDPWNPTGPPDPWSPHLNTLIYNFTEHKTVDSHRTTLLWIS